MKITAALLDTTRAPIPYATSRPLTIEKLELDPPGPGEILVRIKAAGVCHSDLSVVTGDRPRPTPMVLGHEAAGIVEEVGPSDGSPDAGALRPGDHVIFVFMPSCGHCEPCTEGRPALCEPGGTANSNGTLLSGARRLRRANGGAIHHHLGVSAFADHAVVSRRSLIKIDADLPFPVAALFGCAVLTGVGAVVNTAGVRAGASVAVVGLGGVGLACMLGAIAAGARQVIAVDLADDKLVFAEDLGATMTMNAADTDTIDHIRSVTGGGVDFAFELAGSVQALDTAYRITRRGGTTVTAGLPSPTATFPLPAALHVAEERTLKGSYIGTAVPSRDIPRFIALYRRGLLPVDRLMTGTIALDDINLGFDRLRTGRAVRQVIQF